MPISLNSATIGGQTAADESPSSNRYIYNIVVAENAQDGIVQFAIDYSDLNGNPYSNYTTTTDSSYVRLDGTDPEFPDVSISSTGSDPTIAGANDTINLTFHVDEAVSDSSAIILNNTANSITALNNNYFRASYAITGTEGEGKVRFTITATDLAGNNGSIDSTTNNSYVVFDQTPPSNFTVGQVISKEGTEVPDYWNATNQNIEVTVPIDNDSSLFDGAVQVLVSFNGGDTLEIGDPLTIDSVLRIHRALPRVRLLYLRPGSTILQDIPLLAQPVLINCKLINWVRSLTVLLSNPIMITQSRGPLSKGQS
jgi:hypothetical protein